MTLAYEFDLDLAKMSHQVNKFGQKSFCWKITVHTHTHTHARTSDAQSTDCLTRPLWRSVIN